MKKPNDRAKGPVIPITSKYFKYTNAVSTDIRKTFARERARLKDLEPYNDVVRDLKALEAELVVDKAVQNLCSNREEDKSALSGKVPRWMLERTLPLKDGPSVEEIFLHGMPFDEDINNC